MLLPNAENAYIDLAKLIDYCLNETHPIGKHKARVFKSVLGIDASHAATFADIIMEAVQHTECELGIADEYGNRYITDVFVRWEDKSAHVRVAWIILVAENFPRLTSCYIKK